MTDMTQAPTPGPLSGDWPVVTDKWVETYCDLTGRDPDGGSVTFLGDGPVSTSFRDAARREIEAMLCAAPKSAIRSLAPTAPVEASGSGDWTDQDIEDLIADSIGDSIDMDWSPRDGAKVVFAALRKEGLLVAAKTSEQPGLTLDEQKVQASRCSCRGADDMCPCQNTPDRQTIKDRSDA